MKLFIWEGDGVLTDYTNGMVVALAPDLETALKKINEVCSWGAYPALPSQVVDLDAAPEPAVWFVSGGG